MFANVLGKGSFGQVSNSLAENLLLLLLFYFLFLCCCCFIFYFHVVVVLFLFSCYRSKLYGVNATIIIFVFVLYCINGCCCFICLFLCCRFYCFCFVTVNVSINIVYLDAAVEDVIIIILFCGRF